MRPLERGGGAQVGVAPMLMGGKNLNMDVVFTGASRLTNK